MRTDWRELAKAVAREAKARSGLTTAELADELRGMGFNLTPKALQLKLNRGQLSAELLLAMLVYARCERLELESADLARGRPGGYPAGLFKVVCADLKPEVLELTRHRRKGSGS